MYLIHVFKSQWNGIRTAQRFHCVLKCSVNHGCHSLEEALANSTQRGRQLLTRMVERMEDVYAEGKMEKGRSQQLLSTIGMIKTCER